MFKSKQPTKTALPLSASIIATGNTINGNISSEGDIRIDGTIKGNVFSKAKVLIGTEGMVEGTIHSREADISGNVCGNINCKELLHLKGNALHLKGNATVSGDIHTGKLLIEPSVSFNGQCQMGANIVELKSEMAAAVNE